MMRDDADRLIESFASTTQVAAAERLGRSLTVGFGLCDDAGFPLSERQKIAILTAALLGFDGFQVETQGLLTVDRLIADLGRPDALES
jgi:hypothetical protein